MRCRAKSFSLQSNASTDALLQYIQAVQASSTNKLGASSTARGPLEAWELQFDELQIERAIGEGSWGKVYKARWQQTPVAVKILLDTSSSGAESALIQANSPIIARLEKEASVMTSLHHPNVVHFIGLCREPAALVTEYCARGSALEVFQRGLTDEKAAAMLTFKRRCKMVAEAAAGMFHLHSRTPAVLHRDLKAANLLVTADWTVKIADMGLSKVASEVVGNAATTAGGATNPRWLAPEVLGGATPSKATDVYSFGIVLWEALTWGLPWAKSSVWTIVGAVQQGDRPEIPPFERLPGFEGVDQPPAALAGYIALMQRCWAQDPDERPNFEEIAAELQELVVS